MSATRMNPVYKLDYAALEVGSVISTTQLIDLVRCTPESRRWVGRLQALVRAIHENRPNLLCAVRRDTVVVLPPDERAEAITSRLANQVKALASTAEMAQDQQRMAVSEMSPAVKRGFESVAITAGALSADMKRLTAKNEKLAGLLGK